MRLMFSLRLTSPMLGDRNINKVLVFGRERKSELILLDQPQWAWAWATALAEVAGDDVYMHSIRMDRYLANIATQLHSRLYRTGQTRATCDHESIRKGAIVSFGASIVSPDPGEPQHVQRKRIPESHEIYAALVRIGDTLGISPFGSKFGYGRFNIEAMEIDGHTCEGPVGRKHTDGNTELQGAREGTDNGSVGDGAGPQDLPLEESDTH